MKLSETAGKLLKAVVITTLAIIAAGFVYYRSASAFPFAAGAALLAATNAVRTWSLDHTAASVTGADGQKALISFYIMFFARFALTGAALAAAALTPFISLWGAIWGVAVWPVAVIASKYL